MPLPNTQPGQLLATDFIKPHAHEAIKQYITYDGSNRMEYTYTALAVARDGDQCVKTQYVYSGASNRIIKMKETLDVWVSATMDI
jgi:hypothetical protein